jgi:hypothetical protein
VLSVVKVQKRYDALSVKTLRCAVGSHLVFDLLDDNRVVRNQRRNRAEGGRLRHGKRGWPAEWSL